MEDEQQNIDRNLKEGSPTELEIDEEMELDEGSGGEEEEEEEVGDPGSSPSPEEHVALGHGSSEQAGSSGSSFSFSQEDGSAIHHKHSHMSGKPLSLRRGPGRPRKDRPCTRSSKKSIGLKLKRWKSNVYIQPMMKSPTFLLDSGSSGTNPILDDAEPPPESPSPVRSADETPATSTPCVDPDTGQSECTSVTATSKTEKTTASEEPPYFQEQWPGKVCALCNLGERSQLGQGDLMRFSCPEGFTPHKSSDRSDAVEMMSPLSETYTGDTVDRESVGSGGDKSPRGSGGISGVTCRRQKVMAKSRSSSQGSSTEQLDELSVVGHPDEPEPAALFESSGHFYVHQSCALWSSGVTRTEDLVMENVGPAVLEASKRRCSYCSHFGATITCIVNSCARVLHFPCAAASGAFQDCKTVTMVCSQHLDQVPLLLSGDVTCMSCFALGDVSNLMMCTNCGHHYHGSCVGLALFPGVRAGWQCPDCRVCQVCRQPEEDSKVMLCEKCDKAYHPQCLRPIVTTIPKIGWKCKCCRVCSDCGSRTPGAGLSSRWHAHYTVCDSCYQQRNKGFCCPVCGRAYRAAAQREMVQCVCCRKFVHGKCDVDADLATHSRKKESNPDYVYVCLSCKQRTQPGREMLPRRKDSTEDGGLDSSLTGSQESLYAAEDSSMELEYSSSDKYADEGSLRAVGLGKGKPFCASKIAKKKLGFGSVSGRPKGMGNGGTGVGKVIGGYQKRQRVTDFGRKRAPKAKMRGIFGVPGLGLQRPQADSSFNKSEEEPGVENRLVLCSAKDKFVLTQDICVMCGAIGIDQEGCLIACAQCGQCYHPYCVNVKVTKVILQKGWRCLDCTVCEGCGQRNDEGRLILCDDCDISFHIYCMDPPLDYVPHGNWKCKWCAMCVSCGSNDPGFNCMWQKSFTECGPCASHTTCPSCLEPYNEGDLIIQCVQCERWLHCLCDQIRTEAEAERCAEDGYNCVLCRPRDVPPPHLLPPPPPPKPPTPTKSPETPKLSSQAQFYMDGVCLSEMGLHQIKSLTLEQQQQSRKKRITKKIPTKADKEAGILATIESVVAGGSLDSSLEHDPISKLELDEAKEDVKLEPVEVYKEGMVVPPREDGRAPEPPEGFTIHTTESGVMVLRRKRQRNLQKLGIGGFNVRLRSTRNKDKDEEGGGEVASGAVTPTSSAPTNSGNMEGGSAAEDKPRRKAQRRRLKNRLMECYPLYLQEAFFGRDLLDTTKEKDIRSSSDSDEECASGSQVSEDKIIQLSQDELKVMEEVKAKQEKEDEKKCEESESGSVSLKSPGKEEDEGSDTEGLKDILPGDLLDTDLVNTIMNGDDDITKNEDNLDDIGDAAVADDSVNDSLSMPDGSADVSGTSHKDELGDILSPNFNLESMVSQTGLPNMDSKDVEEIFKGVLTDESQESQESVFPLAAVGTATSTPVHTSVPHNAGMVSPSGSVAHPALQSGVTRPPVSGPLPPVGQPNLSPVSFPPPSPYHSEYSNSPFSEPPSPWLSQADVEGIAEGGTASTPTSVNRQSTMKMEADEALGNAATISSVLYANVNHPEWKSEFPAWSDRYKQILKKWRALPSDRKAPFLQQARENRAALRMKKTQQIPKDITKPSIGSVSPQSTPSTSGITGVIGGTSQLAKKAAGGGETGGSVVTSVALVQQKSGAGDGGGSLSPSSNVVEDQEKIMQQQKTCREAEQERQWKQLQALRQQQAQQQQQTIHDQRTQAMVRVHRQISADGVSFPPDQAVSSLTTQLQVSTTQDPNAMAPLSSPSPGSRTQFPSPQVKVSRVHAPHSPGSTAAFPHTNLPPPPLPPPHPTVRQDLLQATRPPALNLPRGAPTAVVRTPEPFSASRLPFSAGSQPQSPFSPQSPHEQFPQSPVPSVAPATPQSAAPLTDPFQRTPSETSSDPYTQPPHTPRPEFITNGHQSQRSPVYVSTPCPTSDPYVQSPATPRPQFSTAATRPAPPVVYTPARLQHPQQDPYTSQPPTPRPAQIDPFVQQITTSRPQDPYGNQPHAPRPQPVDPYVQQPATPRPRTEGEIFGQQQPQQGPEVNRQLRDLLQRQKLEQDQVVQSQPRLWSPQGGQDSGIHQQTSPVQQTSVHFETAGAAPIVQQQQQQAPTSPHPVTATNADTTFRQPLPPALVRPRLPSQGSVVIRGPAGVRHPLQGLDPRLQGLDPRTRMLIQQQRGAVTSVQAYPAHIVHRLAGPRNPLDPYDHLVQQRQQLGFPQDGAVAQGVLTPNATVLATQHLVRPASVEGGHANQLGVQMRLTRVTPQPGHPLDHSAAQRAAMSQTPAGPGQMPAVQQHVDSPAAVTAVAASAPDTQEIPESVTAELEKLEQEGGAMVEVEGVGAILAELGDDKELLEMGNDFNILEYADPELDSVTGGEKTNILDENLDLEEEDNSKEEHKGVKKEVPDKDSNNSANRPEKPAESVDVGNIASARTVVKDDTNSSTSAPSTAVETDAAVTTSPVAMQPATTSQPALQPQPQEIHQHQVQPPQQIQQPQPQPLQQTPVSPLTQQPSVCRPVVAGRMVSPDGGVPVGFQNTFPPAVSSPSVVSAGVAPLQCLPPGHLQVQQQRVQMRMVPAGVREGPARVVSVVPGSPVIQHSGVGVRMGLAPPPPPPPYPGPPPPYPGPCQQEQPLLLEDLLEQEKREQEKQQQHQPLLSQQPQPPPDSASSPLLSDVDFERLRADVLGTPTPTAGSPGLGSPPQGIPAQGLLPSPNLVPVVASNLRQSYPPRPAAQPQTKLIEWQPNPSPGLDTKLGPTGIVFRQQPAPGVQGEATAERVPLFNAPHLPAPPLPPENITTEQDRQTQIHYEQWLNHQNQIVTSQLKYYETEVSKLRKMRKSLNSKQRQLRKSGNELAEGDALELQRISREQSVLQKHLDASRKQSRQHGMLIQEYRNKQQQKQRQQQGPGSVGPPNLLIGPPSLSSSAPQQQSVVIHSPLGPPSSSPIHHPSAPQSPMMSPSPSPMMQQHSSPLHSPGPLLSHSPGPGSVTSVLQHSPGNTGPGSNSGMSPHSMQPSPRMGTPHSQSEECPFSPGTPQELLRSLPSPQQVCPPPTGRLTSPQGHVAPRMTSPQQRVAVSTPQAMGRLVTSPVSYTGSQQQFSGGEQVRIHNMLPRFVRSPLGAVSEPALQRPRGLPVQGPGPVVSNSVMYCQPSATQNMRPGVVFSSSASPSSLGSPQPIISTAVSQQQFQQTASQPTSVCGQMAVRQIQQPPQDHDVNLLLAQRQQLQLVQQRQMIQQQQRQQMIQQQQLVQRGQQQQQSQPPSSPLTPRSPMIGQNQPPSSPMLHQQNTAAPPTSPMPPRSPMLQSLNQSQNPNSPMPPQSPMLQQMNPTQPPSSPMPPCSPVIQQQYQQQISQNQPPSSPILRSPMVQNHAHSVGSPMQMRHHSSAGSVSNSPGLPDRPQSVENPATPRTPHTPHTPYTPQNNQHGGESSQDNDNAGGGGGGGGGGGNPNNPANPLPLPVMFGRFGYFKLGLRGGSPMWSIGSGYGKGGRRNDSRSNDDKKGSGSGSHQEKDGESTSGSKVEGQAEITLTRQSCTSGRETRGGVITPTKSVAVVSTVASLVCADYNDFDDENSHTPPLTPPLPLDDRHHVTSGSLPVDDKAEIIPAVTERISEQDSAGTEKLQESPSEKPSNRDETEREASSNAKELIQEKCSEEIEVAIMSQEDILGSDTVVSSDLPVESLGVEETDCGNVVVFEHLSESDLAQVSSSIDTDIIEECIVTSSDIVMDISVVDALESCEKLTSCIQKEDEEVLHLVEEENKAETGDVDDGLGGIELAEGGDDIPNMDMDVMHILDTGVRGVLDRDPVLDMPEGCREIHSMNERLRIGIVRSLGPLQQEKIVAMTDTPESPDQEEMNVDPSPEPYLPTPDTIKDDEDDMMPMIHDDADMMELDETSGTEIENDCNETEATEINVTSSAEVAASGSTASVDSAGDSSGGTPRTQTGASEEAGKRDHPFGVPLVTQLPPSSVHQANIGVPGSTRTIVTYPTFPSLAVPAASYARGEHLLIEDQANTSATAVAAVTTVITSAVTRQVTSVVPSVVSVPCTLQFSLDSESVGASFVSAAKEKTHESPHISTTLGLTSPSLSSTVVTVGTEITAPSETGLITSECSTTVAHIPQSIIGVSPTFSIIKSSSSRRASVLQGSSGSSGVPVCIIRSQSSGNASVNSTTVSIISSAVASTVTSCQLPSAAVASLVADAVNAARLPYPPASVGQHLPFTKTVVAPLVTLSPAGVSVIANASNMSQEVESLVPPPRMSIAPITSSVAVSSNVPVTVEIDSSSIRAVETDGSSDERQTNAVLNSSPANIQARVGRKTVDVKAALQTSDPRKEDIETMGGATSKLSQVTRPSMLETTNQNMVNELPLQSMGTEISSVQVIQKPVVKVDDGGDDDDEILMKTVQRIFQESRPSVLATADRASSVPPQCAAPALKEETVATEVGSSEWQHNTPVDESVSSSETQQSVAVFNSSVTDKECKKDLTITEKLLHQYSLPSSSTVSAEPDQSEKTKLDYDSSDKSVEIPTQTNSADTQSLLCTSQIQRSLKLPLQAVDSAMPSHTQTVTDVVDAPVTSAFSQAAVCTADVDTTPCGRSVAATIQPCGQSMLQSRLTTGAHQMAGRGVAAPVPSPSVVMTSRLSSTIVSTGQAAASAVKQYVAYTQQQAASQTSPVITGVSKSLAVMSHSPQLLTPSLARLSTQSNMNVLVPSLPTEQSVQGSVLPSRVLESQSSETIQRTQVTVPLVAIQRTSSFGGSIRTASGDVRVQEPVETLSLSGRLGGDVLISACSDSVAISGDSIVDSSKCMTVGYPYASSAPPRIQASSSVYTRVLQPQRRMSTGEMKPEEPPRSCQFEQVATVKTETLGSCLLKETPVPTTGFIVQQQQHSSAVVTAISKPIATSSTVVSRTPVGAVTPKTEAQHLASSCKFSSTQPPMLPHPHRIEESQNVLLKQLLQNTGCAQQTSMSSHHQGLPVVPSLEAQLARPVPPTPSSLLPSLLTNDSPLSQPPKNPQTSRPAQITTSETSFISRPSPPISTSPSTPLVCQQQQTQYSERRPGPPSRTPSREDVLSPPTPSTPRLSAGGADSSHHTPSPLTSPPVMIKKETVPPQQSPVHPVSSSDVKKEIVSDDSAVPLASEKKEFPGKVEQPSRDEMGDLGMETASDKTTQDQAALDIKKIKRRLYQQKRRQSQGKEPAGGGGTPKKQRVRKGSKVDEDYDTYIENLMTQLRQLPPMSVLEPALSRNYAVCSIFGSGDLTKIGTSRDYSTRQGDLRGTFGAAHLAHVSDHYNTQPFGDLPPLPPQPAVSTQRGFYDQEFTALKLENDDDKKQDLQAVMNRDHDNDTPDTVVSSSSPECVIPEFPIRFPGLKLIEEEDAEKEEDTRWMKRASPIVPIISPIPIRPRPGMQIVKEMTEVDKENVGVSRDHIQLKTRFGVSPPAPLRDAGNVTVTLTLTSAAAEDILGVLRNLANILSIPAPSGYQIVERTSTPPSQKLGLYRTKGKDGKEGAPIDIQSILNGAAKFCRHCDVVILSNLIRKKVSELPFLAKDDLVENGDDLYFCSSTCYMQFALMHRSPSISEDKAAAIVDHLCQTTQSAGQKKVHPSESAEKTKKDESIKEKKDEDEKMDTEQQQDEIKVEENVADKDESAETQAKEADCVGVKTDLPVTKSEPEPTPATAVTTPQSTTPPRVMSGEKKSRRHTGDDPVSHCPPPAKVWKGLKYKYWSPGALQPAVKYKRPTDKEITEMLFRMGITMTPAKIPDDTRKCMFCHQIGDGVADGPARLLNFDVDKWVHLNCALWSDDVYETVNGALMNLENSLQQSLVLNCVVCHRTGATIRCFKLRCSNVYHLGCAVKDGCVFFKNKSTYCTAHIPKNEKDNELTTLSVFRRVYVNRDENRQVATVMHQDHNNLLRVGSLIFLSVGQLLPHQLQAFHTPNYIYPIGYKIVRFYWSMRVPNKRCRYVCSIHDVAGRPEFRVLVQEPCQDDLELRDTTPRAVWARILEPLATLRKEMGGVQVFPRYISGEDLFGLTEPAVVRVLESLPGVETLTDYRFKYGRNPLLELPLAVNPTGCARTEPKLRNQFLWKRPHTQRTGSSSRPIFVPTATAAGEAACPYSKQFVHSKSSQYKKMKQEWRNNVYLARSKIQGLGLYAARDLERHTMVIEYIGEVIRTELSELREKLYEARNRGIYMFRLDEDRVVDATLSGGLARYINHSCNPNCVAEIVEVERDLRIIIFAKRRISRGEELAYDYKFDIEDDQHKIPCNCGAPNCRKWMN